MNRIAVETSCTLIERVATIEDTEVQQVMHQLKLAKNARVRSAARIRSQEEGDQPCNEK